MYILAGYDTTCLLFKEIWTTFSEDDSIRLSKFHDGNLITYATYISKISKIDSYSSAVQYADYFAEKLSEMHETSKYFRRCTFIDSGGYQISTGLIPENKLDLVIESYTHFLSRYDSLYDRAFSLDVIPVVYENNLEKFIDQNRIGLMKNMLTKTDKISRIFHITHPGLMNVYISLYKEFFTDPFFTKEKNLKLSVGGLVISEKSQTKLYVSPFFAAVLFLIKLFKHCTGNNPENVEFHILGVSGISDIIKIKFIEKAIKLLCNVNLKITHDSSKIFKAIIRSKTVDYVDINRIDIKEINCTSKMQHHKISHYDTNYTFFIKELQNYVSVDINKLLENNFYDKENKPKKIFDSLLVLFEIMQIKKLKIMLDSILSNCSTVEEVCHITDEISRRLQSSKSYVSSFNQLSNTINLTKLSVYELKKIIENMFQYSSEIKFAYLKDFRVEI